MHEEPTPHPGVNHDHQTQAQNKLSCQTSTPNPQNTGRAHPVHTLSSINKHNTSKHAKPSAPQCGRNARELPQAHSFEKIQKPNLFWHPLWFFLTDQKKSFFSGKRFESFPQQTVQMIFKPGRLHETFFFKSRLLAVLQALLPCRRWWPVIACLVFYCCFFLCCCAEGSPSLWEGFRDCCWRWASRTFLTFFHWVQAICCDAGYVEVEKDEGQASEVCLVTGNFPVLCHTFLKQNQKSKTILSIAHRVLPTAL